MALKSGAAPGLMFMYLEAFGPTKMNPFYLQLGSHDHISMSINSYIFGSTVICTAPVNGKIQDTYINEVIIQVNQGSFSLIDVLSCAERIVWYSKLHRSAVLVRLRNRLVYIIF